MNIVDVVDAVSAGDVEICGPHRSLLILEYSYYVKMVDVNHGRTAKGREFTWTFDDEMIRSKTMDNVAVGGVYFDVSFPDGEVIGGLRE